ncbi:MAG: hypothetical protein ACI4PY_07605 [Akkermansia muciniphila]
MKRFVILLMAGVLGLSLYGCGGGSTVSESYPKYNPGSVLNERTNSIRLSGTVACLDNVTRDVTFEIEGLAGNTIFSRVVLSYQGADSARVGVNVTDFNEYAPRCFTIRGEDTDISYTDVQDGKTVYNCKLCFNAAAARQQLVYLGNPAEGEVELMQRISNLIYIFGNDKNEYVNFTKLSVTELAAP